MAENEPEELNHKPVMGIFQFPDGLTAATVCERIMTRQCMESLDTNSRQLRLRVLETLSRSHALPCEVSTTEDAGANHLVKRELCARGFMVSESQDRSMFVIDVPQKTKTAAVNRAQEFANGQYTPLGIKGGVRPNIRGLPQRPPGARVYRHKQYA